MRSLIRVCSVALTDESGEAHDVHDPGERGDGFVLRLDQVHVDRGPVLRVQVRLGVGADEAAAPPARTRELRHVLLLLPVTIRTVWK